MVEWRALDEMLQKPSSGKKWKRGKKRFRKKKTHFSTPDGCTQTGGNEETVQIPKKSASMF